MSDKRPYLKEPVPKAGDAKKAKKAKKSKKKDD